MADVWLDAETVRTGTGGLGAVGERVGAAGSTGVSALGRTADAVGHAGVGGAVGDYAATAGRTHAAAADAMAGMQRAAETAVAAFLTRDADLGATLRSLAGHPSLAGTESLASVVSGMGSGTEPRTETPGG